MSVNAARDLFVKAVIGLGRDLGMGVVSEGVETREQMEQLVSLAVHIFRASSSASRSTAL